MIESREIGKSATLVTVMKMFEKIKDKSIPEGTIFHSDQGSLYNSLTFQKELENNNFIQSMSRKGTPIDNSPMESFFSTLKSTCLQYYWCKFFWYYYLYTWIIFCHYCCILRC